MGLQCVMGAICQCSFGAAPTPLTVLPTNMVMGGAVPAANIMDYKPCVNILPFGVCTNPAYPPTTAATAAALGVLTPMPCVPGTVAPWIPGQIPVLLANMPTLNDSSKLMCMWGGVISITFAGQATIQV
ncbi:DUF4280 domain-containing protein [Novispirillum sp. DQ9]|uniref:DUF4280 domain-containing protein n=1 Tax=Novispirillum sp. DQ9 TaxID=3398612 RepID=UPI003C7B0FB3